MQGTRRPVSLREDKMTLEELKEDLDEVCRDDYYQDLHDLSPGQLALFGLKDEILALVEAANKMRGQMNEVTDEVVWLEEAIEAFNAKLESL